MTHLPPGRSAVVVAEAPPFTAHAPGVSEADIAVPVTRRARVATFARSSALTAMLLLLLTGTYLAPRLIALDRLVTVDEGYWLGRSANFYQALASGNLADTYQFAHPGVPTMWAGAIAYRIAFPDYAAENPRQLNYVLNVHTALRDLGRDPLTLLVTGRVVKLLMQAACLALGFWLARPVFGTLTATVGTLLMALDPFLIGHDRLLHVDGLFATTAFVSLLALLRARSVGEQMTVRFLALSGFFAALAWLTRTPGFVLVPITGTVLLTTGWQRWRAGAPALAV
ncbi:MAG: glycosyltransferase family 39 protein, partial [Chloroflexota bacterium]|nr:glycosyltransferase family 39 protein [Chloroflexota bacterium]